MTSQILGQAVWPTDLVLASLATTMTVNALATGLIVFRIFMTLLAFRESIVTSDDQLEVFEAIRTKFRFIIIIFILIESGLFLFAIQLARLVVTVLTANSGNYIGAFDLIVYIHQQLNVIRRSVIPTFYFTDLNFERLGNNTYNHPGAGLNGILFPRPEFAGRSCALCA